MALSNYTDLQAAVASWLTRTDQTTNIPDFIRLYEADANRRIRIRQNLLTTQVTLSQGTAGSVLPSDFLEEVELNYDDTSIALTKMSFDDLDRLNTADSAAGRPAFYAITSNGSQEIAIYETEADQTYTLNLRYYAKWSVTTSQVNWLLSNAPDAYLFGALAEAAMRAEAPLLVASVQGAKPRGLHAAAPTPARVRLAAGRGAAGKAVASRPAQTCRLQRRQTAACCPRRPRTASQDHQASRAHARRVRNAAAAPRTA
jgi:hypothetical protein